MTVNVPGHTYELPNFENQNAAGQTLQFIHKKPRTDNPDELYTVQDGTTTEAVIEALVDRVNFLQSAHPCRENAIVITKLEEALLWLNKRTADRQKRAVEGTNKA